MKIAQELKSTTLIYLKAFLFFFILLISFIAIILETQDIYITILLLLIIWSSARLYYFMFYVIEKYVDSQYKFSGVWSFLQYWFHRNKK
jgi:hypothetical protein